MEEAEQLWLWDILPPLSLSNSALSNEVIFFYVTLILRNILYIVYLYQIYM